MACLLIGGLILLASLSKSQPVVARLGSHTVSATDRNAPSDRKINPVDGAETVRIPTGDFIMGSNAAEIDRLWRRFNWPEEWKQFTRNEQPAHRVRVDGFWMYRHDVTVARYRKFCNATRRSMPAAPSWGWLENHPIVNVSWHDAKAYCSWARARLPYEAEWEYAAQGGNTGLGGRARTVFVWGDEFPKDKVANLADQSFKQSPHYNSNFHLFVGYNDGYTYTSPVDAFPANGFGLYDMAGNVWQWCADWADYNYYRSSPVTNPHGPSSGQRHVLRGGAFDTTSEITRISRRISNVPDIQNDEKGFRCVQ